MDFDFSEEQYMFQEATRGFLEKNHNLQRLRAEPSEAFDHVFWTQLSETGAFAMLVPEQFGGLGMGLTDLALVLEEYGRALIPVPVTETIGATDVIARFGTEEQKARLLPRIAEGQLKVVPAVAERTAGYGTADVTASATSAGNGWRLSGHKVLVPNAAIADLILVATRFDNETLGLVMIENDRNGVSLDEHHTLDLMNPYHELRLDSVSIAPVDVLGGVPSSAPLDRLLDVSALLGATMMTGISGKVLEKVVDYVAQRTQFGKPIGSFQAIKHRCADMAVQIEASRSAAYYAAWALAEESPNRSKAISMAKSYCGDASRFVCNQGVQLHGGIGFTWELGLHLFLRRAKVLEYSYGDANYHRERVLSETLSELGLTA
jgi:alkylation response protein AidB-like acyl-CoA dehydrogenase